MIQTDHVVAELKRGFPDQEFPIIEKATTGLKMRSFTKVSKSDKIVINWLGH